MKKLSHDDLRAVKPPGNARTVVQKQRGEVPTAIEWQQEASGILRSLIARDGLRPEKVVDLLQRRGVMESDRGFKEKALNGTFSLAWFLQFIVATERHPFKLETDLTLPVPCDELQQSVRASLKVQMARNSARAKKGIKKRGEKPLPEAGS